MASESVHRVMGGVAALPFAYLLTTLGQPLLAALSVVLTTTLVQAPDVDHRLRGVRQQHTHTLLFGLAVAVCLGAIGWIAADRLTLYAGVGSAAAVPIQPHELAICGFVIGGQSIGSHLFTDMVTRSDVHPLWPVSSVGGSMDGLRFLDPRKNDGRYVVGTVSLTVAGTALLMTLI